MFSRDPAQRVEGGRRNGTTTNSAVSRDRQQATGVDGVDGYTTLDNLPVLEHLAVLGDADSNEVAFSCRLTGQRFTSAIR